MSRTLWNLRADRLARDRYAIRLHADGVVRSQAAGWQFLKYILWPALLHVQSRGEGLKSW